MAMPNLLIYADEDAEIADIMNAIYQYIPEPKQLEILPVKSHGTDLLKANDELKEILIDFLNSLE